MNRFVEVERNDGICANCGAPLHGPYCSRCGERRLDRRSFKLSVFAAAVLAELIDLEHSKLLRTLRTLVFEPGALTNEYFRGRRKSFIGPVKIFLYVFALSFLLYSVFRTTSVYDLDAMITIDTSGTIKTAIERVATVAHLSAEATVAEINARWQKYLTLTQIFYPLGLAILFQVLYFRTRRYFAEHVIFALHFSAIGLGMTIVLWPVYALVGVQPSPAYLLTSSFLILLPAIWFLIASRRVYGNSWLMSALKTIIVQASYLLLGTVLPLLTLWLAVWSFDHWR